MKVALGFRTHLGWTAAVAIGGRRKAPKVLDRRTMRSAREAHEVVALAAADLEAAALAAQEKDGRRLGRTGHLPPEPSLNRAVKSGS